MNNIGSKEMIISGASVLVGYSLRELARKKWKKMYKEEPPTNHPSEEINWKKVITWSIITGTLISSAKLATERYLTLKFES